MLINGGLAMAEIAVVSARKVRLQQGVEKGDAGARGTLVAELHSLAFPSERQGLSHRECGGVALLEHVTNLTDVRVQSGTPHLRRRTRR
jgi:hypothetical protein